MDDTRKDSAARSFLGDRDASLRLGQSDRDMWETPGDRASSSSSLGQASTQRGRWFAHHSELLHHQPSPSVTRNVFGSQALRRRSGAAEMIQQSLAALDEVVSAPPPSTSHTGTPSLRGLPPGSLLRESVRHPLSQHMETTPPGHTSFTTPLHTRLPDTPLASMSIMDETGLARDLVTAPTPTTIESPQGDRTRVSHMTGHMTFLEDTLLGQPDMTMMEDPVEKIGSELVTSFHQALSSLPHTSDVIQLAETLERSCETQLIQLKEVEEQTTSTLSPQMLMELTLERGTWQLLHVLYRDRVESGEQGEGMTGDEMGYQSEKEVAEDYFQKNSAVRQAQLVVDWLEENALSSLESYPVKVNYFADSVTWENTLHDIEHGTGKGHIVSEMDPDAPVRQHRHLSELDSKDELALAKHLFACIRAGQLSKAQELCLECGQPWKAAALEGWKLYHDPNLGKSMTDDLDVLEGNLGRDLWKASCWELVREPGYSVYDKAIFAALSGNLKQLLPACQSWYDWVWAHFKVMVDILTEERLREHVRTDGRGFKDLPPEYWSTVLAPEVVFQEIEASPSQLVQKQCQNHFHIVQKFIILDDMEGLVAVMHGWLKDSPTIHQLRLMAHLVVFVRGLGAAVDEDMCTQILEAYVKGLTQHQYSSLVALYTARLTPPLQVTYYAQLLEGIQDTEEQKMCLELGRKAGLDVGVITKAVVENIRNTGMDVSMDTAALELGKEVEITRLDWSKIQVLNWLVFEESQRAEAIRQGCALIRAFLAMRKHSAAREVFRKIPPDSVDVIRADWSRKSGGEPLPPGLANDVREYHCIQAYLDANDAFTAWFQHFHHQKPAPPSQPTSSSFTDKVAYEHWMKQYQTEEERWRQQLYVLTQDAETKLYNVLLFVGGGWMVDSPCEGPVDETRASQMNLLRQLCLPRLCFLLHSLLHSTQQHMKCLQLADVVASETNRLYKEFRPDELQKLLSLLQKTALQMVDDQQCDELGYDIA